MKAILKELLAGNVLAIGKRFKIFTYTADTGRSTMSVREEGTGLMGPIVPVTRAGLKRLLSYIDTEIVLNPNR